MTDVPIPESRGLQAERTDLSWSRTALAFAVNGSLLLLRQHMSGPTWLHIAGACLAVILLIFTLVMSHRRRRVLVKRPLPMPLADPIALTLLACGTSLLGLTTLVMLIA